MTCTSSQAFGWSIYFVNPKSISDIPHWYLYTIVRIIAVASYFLVGQVAVEHYLSRMSSGTKLYRILLSSAKKTCVSVVRVRLARLDSPMRKFAFGSSIERGVAGSFDRS